MYVLQNKHTTGEAKQLERGKWKKDTLFHIICSENLKMRKSLGPRIKGDSYAR